MFDPTRDSGSPNGPRSPLRRGMIRALHKAISAILTRRVSFDMDLVPLTFERLPLRKVVNWILTESSVVFKPGRPWGLPTVLQVEPTSRCNLRCTACPVGSGLGRAAGDMDLPMFQRILDELGAYLFVILFWDWGEPFLNPCAYEMIRAAGRAGIRVVCSTNGQVFADQEHARRVVESGLDEIVFSVDGITQETYERNRRGGSLDRVLEGIEQVVAEKRRLGSDTPLVNFRFIVMKHDEHEIPGLRDFASDLGVDVLTLRKLHFVPGTGTEIEGGSGEKAGEHGSALVPSETAYRLPLISQNGKGPLRVERNPCRNLWNCPTIHWDGTVCSCFMDYEEKRPLGCLRDQSFRAIWYGEPYRRLRRAFREKWQDVPLCKDCASGFQGGDVGREANAEAFFLDRPDTGNRR